MLITDICDICGEPCEFEGEEYPFYVCEKCKAEEEWEWEDKGKDQRSYENASNISD